jgi:hypothetical protein
MDLYIANCGKKKLEFLYRVPGSKVGESSLLSKRIYRMEIAIGEQVRIPSDKETIASIIDQHRKYGMIQAAEVVRTKNFVGYCFQTEKPISSDVFMVADEGNGKVLDFIGKESRVQAALAINNAIEESLKVEHELGASVRHTEVSIVEEGRRGDPDHTPKIAEGVQISNENERGAVRKGRHR